MNSTLGVSAILKPYTKCNHLVLSVASLAVFESDRNASERRSCSFFMYNGDVDSVYSFNSFTRLILTLRQAAIMNQNVPLPDKNGKIFLGRAHN